MVKSPFIQQIPPLHTVYTAHFPHVALKALHLQWLCMYKMIKCMRAGSPAKEQEVGKFHNLGELPLKSGTSFHLTSILAHSIYRIFFSFTYSGNYFLRSQISWVQIQTLPLIKYRILEKLYNLSASVFPLINGDSNNIYFHSHTIKLVLLSNMVVGCIMVPKDTWS